MCLAYDPVPAVGDKLMLVLSTTGSRSEMKIAILPISKVKAEVHV
jgi:hypothetical protein